jgi:hypothetical protein
MRMSFSQSKAFQRTLSEKRALLRELEETLKGTTVRGLRKTLPRRIEDLKFQIAQEERAEKIRAAEGVNLRNARATPARSGVRS